MILLFLSIKENNSETKKFLLVIVITLLMTLNYIITKQKLKYSIIELLTTKETLEKQED